MADTLIPIGSITAGVGACWLVDICHEDGPVSEAWRNAYTSLRRAKDDVVNCYPDTDIVFSRMASTSRRGYLVYAQESTDSWVPSPHDRGRDG